MRIALTARDGEVTFDCDADREILLAGLAAGHGVPYECGTGTCGTCKAALDEGEVDPGWADAPAREMLRAGRNEILMCQARPRSDCRLSIRGRLAEPGAFTPDAVDGDLVSVESLNHDVLQLEIRPDRPLRYDAGQFMLVDVPGVPGYRGWSMATYESDGARLVFTVKMMPGGLVSTWLRAADRGGTRVRVFGPLGRAAFRPERDAANLVCIAGGSGLAPMLAILDRAMGAGHFEKHRADLFFGVRTFADLYKVDQLLAIAAAAPDKVSLTFAFSEAAPSEEARASLPGVTIAQGFVHEVMGAAMAGRLEGVLAYMAGAAADGGISDASSGSGR